MALGPAVRSLTNTAEQHGGPGHYSILQHTAGSVSTPEPMTETYGVLTVGAVNSGTVAIGQEVTGAGVRSARRRSTAIWAAAAQEAHWIVNNAHRRTVTGDITMTATPLQIDLNWDNQPIIGATANSNDFFDIMPNGSFGFDHNPSTLSYTSGTAAAALGLTQASGAIDFIAGRPAPVGGTVHGPDRFRTRPASSVRFRPTVPESSQESGGLGSVD